MSIDSFNAEIEFSVVVVIDYFASRPGNPNADNDIDYYGETEIEWHLEDDKGNRLSELEKLLTQKQIDDVNDWIYGHMESYYHDDGPEPDDYDYGYYDGRYDP